MGVFDFVKAGTQAMCIARPEQFKGLLVYRHEGGNQGIPMFSQLTVESDECAVFYKDGVNAAVLPPGRHTLHTQNIPLLQPFITSFTGGNLFIAEIYFVKTVPIRSPGMKFGGSCGEVIDPFTGTEVGLRINGECAVVVSNPVAFITGYHGQSAGVLDNQVTLKWVAAKFMNSVGTVITNLCNQKFGDSLEGGNGDPKTSILRVLNDKVALGQAFMASVPDLDAIGIKICDTGEINPNVSEADQLTLRAAAEEFAKANREVMVAKKAAAAKQFEINQDIARQQAMSQMAGSYQAYAAGQAMIGAGQGMAAHGMGSGGVAGMGAQMAIGVGMGQQFAGGFAGPAQPPPQQPMQPQYAPASTMVTCSKCATKQPGGKFCAECGTTLAQQKKFCTGCGQETAPAAKFCAGCGTPATATGAAAPGVVAPPA